MCIRDSLASVLRELIAYRVTQDVEEQAARALAEGRGIDRLSLVAARFTLALAKLQEELDRRLDLGPSHEYARNLVEILDLLTGMLLQEATPSGNLHEPDCTVVAPLLDEVKIVGA